jgi:flagellar basal-body rod protein FlgC
MGMTDRIGNFTSMRISAQGLSAQRLRMDIIAENIANASTTRTKEGGPYRRKEVLVQESRTSRAQPFGEELKAALDLSRPNRVHLAGASLAASRRHASSVEVAAIVEDPTEGATVYDPAHPDANEDGYVQMPNVQIVQELVGLMGAARAYEANLAAMRAAQDAADATLRIGV